MKADPNAATLRIVGRPPKSDEKVTIVFDRLGNGASGFELLGADGEGLATSEHPRPLVRYAWANGALEIRHAYDLKLAEWP